MSVHAPIYVVIGALIAAGCAPATQRSVAAVPQEQAIHSAIDAERVCDANAVSEQRSLWTSMNCPMSQAAALPPECEKVGTDDLPVCHAWGIERAAAIQAAPAAAQQETMHAALVGIFGYGW